MIKLLNSNIVTEYTLSKYTIKLTELIHVENAGHDQGWSIKTRFYQWLKAKYMYYLQ
jgi:hypothetical protein